MYQNCGYNAYRSQTSGNNIQEGITGSTYMVTMHAIKTTEI